MPKKEPKVGLWMIGACGGVGSTVALGLAALRRGITESTGLVTALAPFRRAGLVAPASITVGGHEIRSCTLLDSVRESQSGAGLFSAELVKSCGPQLRSMQRNLRPGTLCGAGPTMRQFADASLRVDDRSPAEAVERLSADLSAFRQRCKLDHVVVIHVASSEPQLRRQPAHGDFKKLQRAMLRPGSNVLPASSIYALAAIESGCAYINFTPSPGMKIPALTRRAAERGIAYMGSDGKTGETLVKSALAPMFAMRNLSVLSWVGENILGNRDGKVLRDPAARAGKLNSKDKTLSRILGRKTVTGVSIDFVESLDDWKVAWDFIHFAGFLGTKMSMQFTWQGSDSILAAPLVIDLARLAALECAAGRSGVMRHLAFFFKDPIDSEEHELSVQWRQLVEHVAVAQT